MPRLTSSGNGAYGLDWVWGRVDSASHFAGIAVVKVAILKFHWPLVADKERRTTAARPV